MYSTASCTSRAASTSSFLSGAMPESARASIKRLSARARSRSVSSSMLPITSRQAWSVELCSATSPMLRMAVRGVRSSCDASAVKRFNRSKESCRREKVVLKTMASLPNSSFGFSTGRRSESRSAVISCAFETMPLIGDRALPARRYPPTSASAKAPGNPSSSVRARLLRLRRTGRSSSATITRKVPSAVCTVAAWMRYDSPVGNVDDQEPSSGRVETSRF